MTFILLSQLRASDRLEIKLYDYLPIEYVLPFHFVNKTKHTQLTFYLFSDKTSLIQ